jgi:hypothetical protein
MSTLIPVWSGQLERAGQCAGLSGYRGPSQLAQAGTLAWRPTPGQRITTQQVATQPKPTVAQIKERRRRGYSVRNCAQHFGVSQSYIALRDTRRPA